MIDDEIEAFDVSLLRLLGGSDTRLAHLYCTDAVTKAILTACAKEHTTRAEMLERLALAKADECDRYRKRCLDLLETQQIVVRVEGG